MKSKQLAYVLIKVMGIYLCVSNISGCLAGIIFLLSSVLGAELGGTISRMGVYSSGDVLEAVVGFYLTINSRKLAEFWFKNEEGQF